LTCSNKFSQNGWDKADICYEVLSDILNFNVMHRHSLNREQYKECLFLDYEPSNISFKTASVLFFFCLENCLNGKGDRKFWFFFWYFGRKKQSKSIYSTFFNVQTGKKTITNKRWKNENINGSPVFDKF